MKIPVFSVKIPVFLSKNPGSEEEECLEAASLLFLVEAAQEHHQSVVIVTRSYSVPIMMRVLALEDTVLFHERSLPDRESQNLSVVLISVMCVSTSVLKMAAVLLTIWDP